MMFGVCKVFVDYGGGGGYYVGGVCRTTRQWWSPLGWVDQPVYQGPFPDRASAEAFIQQWSDIKIKGLGYFIYVDGDPFGELGPEESEVVS